MAGTVDAPYCYRVVARCQAVVTETWRVRSHHPLTEEQARQAVLDGYVDDAEDVEFDCGEEDVTDEENREIVSVECLDGEFRDPQGTV